jgi:hypothetical protein
MKLTAITGAKGKLVALVTGHLSEHDRTPPAGNQPHATLRPQKGQAFHELVVPADYATRSKGELRDWVVQHLAGRKT